METKRVVNEVVIVGMLLATTSGARGDEWRLVRGMRVRINTGDSVAMPGVATIDGRATEARRPVVDEDRGSIAFQMGTDRAPLRLARPNRAFTGTVIENHGDDVVVQTKEHPEGIRIPHAAIARLQVSTGETMRWRPAMESAGIGALLLGTVATVYVANEWHQSRDLIIGGGAGAASGALVGAIIGGAVGSERWRTLRPVHGGPSVVLAPRGAKGVEVSVTF